MGSLARKALHGMRQGLSGAVRGLSYAYGYATGNRKPLRLLSVFFIAFYYMCAIVIFGWFAPINSFVNYFMEDSDGYITNFVSDAKGLYDYVFKNGGKDADNELIRMDSKMIQTIMSEVMNYNDKMNKKEILEYTCRVYEGEIESIDYVTGTVEVKPIKTEEESLLPSVDIPLFAPIPIIPVVGDSTSNMLMLGTFSGSILTNYNMLVSAEGQVKEEKELYTDESRFVTVSRGEIDTSNDNNTVFDVEWVPVLVMCSMLAQERDDYGEDESAYITNEMIDRVMELFRGTYIYMDDCTADMFYDPSFERIEKGNKGYKINILQYENEVSVERIPAIAPVAYISPLVTYRYEYEELSDGTLRLKGRTSYYTTTEFLKKANEIIPEFDEKLFIEAMSLIPGTQDIVHFYKGYFNREIISEYTENGNICSCIGTYVSPLNENVKVIEE